VSKNRKRQRPNPQKAWDPVVEGSRQASRRTGRLLTIAEVQERCGVKERTVRTWIFVKRLPYVKLGRYVRINEHDLNDFINSNRIEPTD